jgi:hypothetical protein
MSEQSPESSSSPVQEIQGIDVSDHQGPSTGTP